MRILVFRRFGKEEGSDCPSLLHTSSVATLDGAYKYARSVGDRTLGEN